MICLFFPLASFKIFSFSWVLVVLLQCAYRWALFFLSCLRVVGLLELIGLISVQELLCVSPWIHALAFLSQIQVKAPSSTPTPALCSGYSHLLSHLGTICSCLTSCMHHALSYPALGLSQCGRGEREHCTHWALTHTQS